MSSPLSSLLTTLFTPLHSGGGVRRVWVGGQCGFSLLWESLKSLLIVFFLFFLPCTTFNFSPLLCSSSGVPGAVQWQRPIRQGLLCVLQRLERTRVWCPCHAVHRPSLQRPRHLHRWQLCVLHRLQRAELCRGWEEAELMVWYDGLMCVSFCQPVHLYRTCCVSEWLFWKKHGCLQQNKHILHVHTSPNSS